MLNDIKKQLGIADEDDSFDRDILLCMDTIMGIIYETGATETLSSVTPETEWDEVFADDTIRQLAKTYMYLKVRLLFDPPTNSSIQKAFEEHAKELEWRMYCINNKAEN